MKKYKTVATAFIITALFFCSALCLLGIFLVPAEVGTPELPAGETVSGIDYGSAPEPISIRVTSSDGGALLYFYLTKFSDFVKSAITSPSASIPPGSGSHSGSGRRSASG